MLFRLFKVWERSEYHTLPYPGAWLEQPQFIIDGFETLLAVRSWHGLNGTLPSTEGLPKIDDVA